MSSIGKTISLKTFVKYAGPNRAVIGPRICINVKVGPFLFQSCTSETKGPTIEAITRSLRQCLRGGPTLIPVSPQPHSGMLLFTGQSLLHLWPPRP